MKRHLLFTHITEKGYAQLEDQEGNTVSLPLRWLPKTAAPGAKLYGACVSDDEISSFFLELDTEPRDWGSKNVLGERELETLLEP